MRINAAEPFSAFLSGRQARQDEEYGNTRNALAQQELANEPAQLQRRNKLADLQISGLEESQNAAVQERKQAAYAQIGGLAQKALQSGDPRGFVQQALSNPAYTSLFQQAEIDPRQIDLNSPSFERDLQSWASLGAQPKTPEAFTLSAGQTRYGPDGKPTASAPVSNEMTPYQKERLSIERQKLNQKPSETGPLVQVAGPDGNPIYKTREEAVNQPAYVARDKPAAADLKYQREIKSKQPRLKAARRRVDRLSESILGALADPKTGKAAVKGIAQNTLFDGGPLDQYALAWTKQGQEVSQSKAALLSELTALTRVPGIGSQSDLETRLASLPFPSSEFGPEVNRKAVAEIQAFVADLEDAYGAVQGEFQSAEIQTLLDKYAPQ